MSILTVLGLLGLTIHTHTFLHIYIYTYKQKCIHIHVTAAQPPRNEHSNRARTAGVDSLLIPFLGCHARVAGVVGRHFLSEVRMCIVVFVFLALLLLGCHTRAAEIVRWHILSEVHMCIVAYALLVLPFLGCHTCAAEIVGCHFLCEVPLWGAHVYWCICINSATFSGLPHTRRWGGGVPLTLWGAHYSLRCTCSTCV